MRRRCFAIAVVHTCCCTCVGAHSHYQDSIPNGRNVKGVPGGPDAWHGVGHMSPNPISHTTYIMGGFPRNQFGRDFAAVGHRWTKALCRMDSDMDGLSNGGELGDPQCVWKPGDLPQRTDNITHPGLSPAQLLAWSTAALARQREAADAARGLPAAALAAHGGDLGGWKSGGTVQDPFTQLLLYYQYIAIPMLLFVAVALSSTRFGARHAPFPRPLGIFAMYYLLFIVGVGCGVHRYFSHKAFTASRPLKRFLTILSLFVGQGGPLDWAYVHRIHHRLCEHELDYHSPHLSDVRHSSALGFAYAQGLWMIWPHPHVKRSPALEQYHCGDIINDPDIADLIQWMTKRPEVAKGLVGWVLPMPALALGHLLWHALLAPPSAAKGGGQARPTILGRIAGAYVFPVYYFYLPVALTWMSTGFVNSATHLWGDQPFEDGMMAGCQSKNNAFLFLPMLGENWHNNHHAVPASLSTWVVWYQVDLVYLTGRVFELVGLASEIRVEVPHQLTAAGQPPTGFPAFAWTLTATVWTILVSIAWRLHTRKPSPVTSVRSE